MRKQPGRYPRRHNQTKATGASADYARYQAEAERIWLRQPHLTKQAVAEQVKKKLKAPQKVETIADRLNKVPIAR